MRGGDLQGTFMGISGFLSETDRIGWEFCYAVVFSV